MSNYECECDKLQQQIITLKSTIAKQEERHIGLLSGVLDACEGEHIHFPEHDEMMRLCEKYIADNSLNWDDLRKLQALTKETE